MCFSTKTSRHVNIKLGTIDHYFGVSVITVAIEDNSLNLHLTKKTVFFCKHEAGIETAGRGDASHTACLCRSRLTVPFIS